MSVAWKISNTTMKKRTQNSSTPQGSLTRRKYDEEFKQQALTMIRNEQTVRSVAEALGISENLLHQWKRAARANQSAAELEVEQLRRQLKQVDGARYLKKALAVFSRQT
jgi:transposase-like protein